MSRRLSPIGLAAALFLSVFNAHATTPDSPMMQGYGTDMGRAQRCGVAVSEVLLFSQLAKDLAQRGGNAEALNAAFLSAAAAARDGAAPDCKAATARFDAATEELYKHTGR